MSLDLAACSDAELATFAIAGRDSAYAEIIQRHKGALHRIAAASTGDPDEALDLLQETFISAHRALARFDPQRSMRTWLAAITLNKCRDWRRRRAVRRLFSFALPIDALVERIAEDRPPHDTAAEDRQELERACKAIESLPTSLREPLVLHTIDGMSQAETALALSISEKAVETRLRRARIKLAEALERP